MKLFKVSSAFNIVSCIFWYIFSDLTILEVFSKLSDSLETLHTTFELFSRDWLELNQSQNRVQNTIQARALDQYNLLSLL